MASHLSVISSGEARGAASVLEAVAMCSLGRSSLLLALALCVSIPAHARPGANDIAEADVTETNAVPTTNAEIVQLKAGLLDIPVNERFPSAVLFKGTCGGTIISSKWILTAGHCTLFSSGRRNVVAGTNTTDDGSGVSRRVKRLVIHPHFSVGPYWLDADEFNIKQVAARWDFLLAELSEPLPLDGKTMKAATLDDELSLPVGLEVGYAGYGTDHHGGFMRSEMHGMELAIQSNETCSTLEQYENDNMLCAKGLPPRFDSACNGDSGSGLVDSKGRLVGVASWVQNDAHECKNGNIVVFSRVAAVRDWIRQVTKV